MAEAKPGEKKRRVPKGRHLSQMKRERQGETRRLRNQGVRSSLKTAVKKVRHAISQKDKKGAASLLPMATSILYRAASKRVIHPRNAARHVARLSQAVASLA